MVSEKFKEFCDKWVESSASNNVEAWKDRYYCKTKAQLEEDLYINHDDTGEEEFVRDEFTNATDEEVEYYIERFKKEVLKQLGHGD